jgi:hypothetical protein
VGSPCDDRPCEAEMARHRRVEAIVGHLLCYYVLLVPRYSSRVGKRAAWLLHAAVSNQGHACGPYYYVLQL